TMSAYRAQTGIGLALQNQQIEARRLVVAEDGGEQSMRLAAVMGLVIEKVIERRRQRLLDGFLRGGECLIAQRPRQLLLIESVDVAIDEDVLRAACGPQILELVEQDGIE